MAKTTTDHDTIRAWADKHGGKPAAVDRTHKGRDVGIIRIMFPENPQSEHGSLVEISWDEFFEQFEEAGLALLFEENSLFSKIVGRDTVEERAHGDNHASRHEGRHEKDSHASGSRERRVGSGRGEAHASATAKSGGAESRAKGKSDGGAKTGGKETSETASLKEREYRDAEGNVHHHTRTYMESHRK